MVQPNDPDNTPLPAEGDATRDGADGAPGVADETAGAGETSGEAPADPDAPSEESAATAGPAGAPASVKAQGGPDEPAPPTEAGEAQQATPPAMDWKAEHDKVKSQLLRVAADFENYRKRVQRDIADAAHRARDEVLQELLPVVDNLERAVEHAETTGAKVDPKTLLDGVKMVLRQFEAAMERFEVRGFSALGQPFDPAVHEAMQQRETADAPPGTVVEEYRKGYMMGERLVRPAMVVVAAAPATAADEGGGAGAAEGVGEPETSGQTSGAPSDEDRAGSAPSEPEEAPEA